MTGELRPGEESLRAVRRELSRRLRMRQPEIEQEIFERTRDLPETARIDDEYERGLLAAVAEAVSYTIFCIEMGDDWRVPVPPAVAAQARLAARESVTLATALRRCSTGNLLLEEHIVVEAEDMPTAAVRQILHEQVPYIDRMIVAITENYADAQRQRRGSLTEKRAERLEHLLDGGEPAATEDINYDFDGWHVGAVMVGVDAGDAVHTVTSSGNLRLLAVKRDPATAWVWIGSPRRPSMAEVELCLLKAAPSKVSVTIGLPRQGLAGWRLTHREARAAVRIVLRQPSRLTRACEVAILIGTLKDETLVRSLVATYLAPLGRDSGNGRMLRETVRAYLETGCNAAAAASALRVHRHTVQRRIRTVERLIGQLLPDCYAELQVALRLADLDPDICAAETG